jgi:hypothetical protein
MQLASTPWSTGPSNELWDLAIRCSLAWSSQDPEAIFWRESRYTLSLGTTETRSSHYGRIYGHFSRIMGNLRQPTE